MLAGPKEAPASSRGTTRPLVIESVYLFDANEITDKLRARGVKLSVATSVAKRYWEEAEIYPAQRNRAVKLSEEQMGLLGLFR